MRKNTFESTKENHAYDVQTNFNALLNNAKNLLNLTNDSEAQSEIFNTLFDIKIAEELQFLPPKKSRNKRQASTDCISLQNQITTVQANIVATQKSITNLTTTLNTYNQNIVNYQQKMQTAKGSTLLVYQTLLKTQTTLVTSTQSSLTNAQNQLNIYQAQQSSLLFSYDQKCSNSAPCGKW